MPFESFCDWIWQLCVFLCVCVVPQVELKFPAPSKTGNYQYSVILRSDSYLGLDQIKPLKVRRERCVCVRECVCGVQRSDNTPTIHSQNATAAEQWW